VLFIHGIIPRPYNNGVMQFGIKGQMKIKHISARIITELCSKIGGGITYFLRLRKKNSGYKQSDTDGGFFHRMIFKQDISKKVKIKMQPGCWQVLHP
jgi:hypothetical protein